MKKIILSLMVAAATFFMTSCDQPDVCININVETVPCTFVTSSIIPDVDDAPMTRTEHAPLRTIRYEFTSANHPTIKGTVLEHDNLYLDLVKGATYNGKFFYAADLDTVTNMVRVDTEHIYKHDSIYVVTGSFEKSIKLTREIGQLVAKVGHIPSNTTVTFTIKTMDYLNLKEGWYDSTSSAINTKTGLVKDSTFSQLGAVSTHSDTLESSIEVFLYQGDKLKKTSKHFYHLNKNKVKTVTFNINNVNPDGTELGDLYIDIDEAWDTDIDKDENQQIGKN